MTGDAALWVLVAWQAGALSEGQAARLLKVDRITLREARDEAIARALRLLSEQKDANG